MASTRPLTFSTETFETPSMEKAFSKTSSFPALAGREASRTAKAIAARFMRSSKLLTESAAKSSHGHRRGSRRGDDARSGGPVAPAGSLSVSQDGPGVHQVPDGHEQREVAAHRAPGPRRPSVRVQSLQSEPAAGAAARGVPQKEGGGGACPQRPPDPGDRGPPFGHQAPESPRGDQAQEVGRGGANQPVQEECENASPQHDLLGRIVNGEV